MNENVGDSSEKRNETMQRWDEVEEDMSEKHEKL